MKIIDAHMHFSKIKAFYEGAEGAGVIYSASGLFEEYTQAGVVHSVCMGLNETAPGICPDHDAQTPMFADLGTPLIPMSINMGVNPHQLTEDNLKLISAAIKDRKEISGFKIYAGYYHEYIYSEVYKPIYRLAEENGLAVAIHCGDTYFKGGLVEYSNPIHVDRVANEFRDLNIVICHVGFPWVMEACEIAYKHDYVHVDISGLSVGNAAECRRMIDEPLITNFFKQGFVFLNNYKKVIFGTDWPLTPVAPYIDFCKSILPEWALEDVFYGNAARVYGIK